MADEQKVADQKAADQAVEAVEAFKEREAQATPMTVQAFADAVNALIDRAQADSLNPLPVLAMILTKRGMSLIDQGRTVLANAADDWLTRYVDRSAKAGKK